MISRIARLRAKKGFTIVELIVVMAIMGILMGMVIPMLTYDRKPAVARAMTKEIYYRAQSVLADCKAARKSLPVAEAVCYYVEVSSTGIAEEIGFFIADDQGTLGTPVVYTGSSTSDTLYKMKEVFEKYITDESIADMEGHLIVAVDQSYRVIAAYWMENFNFLGRDSFAEDNILSTGQFCVSYPNYLCTADGSNFTFLFDKVTSN